MIADTSGSRGSVTQLQYKLLATQFTGSLKWGCKTKVAENDVTKNFRRQ